MVQCISLRTPNLITTLSVYGVEAERRRWTYDRCTTGRYAETARRPQRSTCRLHHDAVIPTYRRYSRDYRRYFAPSGSKMAAKTTSGSGFDVVFRLLVSGFPLESRPLAVYLHAIGHWRLQCSYCKASAISVKFPSTDGQLVTEKCCPTKHAQLLSLVRSRRNNA